MTRGTTVTLNFTLPIDVSTISVCNITFAQSKTVILEKTLSDCSISSTYVLSLPLTQADTLLFDARLSLLIQLRLKVGNTVMASQIIETDVNRILKEGEI